MQVFLQLFALFCIVSAGPLLIILVAFRGGNL